MDTSIDIKYRIAENFRWTKISPIPATFVLQKYRTRSNYQNILITRMPCLVILISHLNMQTQATSFLTVPFQPNNVALVTKLSQQRKRYVNFTTVSDFKDPASMNDSVVDAWECQ